MFLLYFFSRYVNPFEKKVERFLRWVSSFRNSDEVRARLQELLQENAVIVSIWLEKRFKNYRILKKRNRRRMYKNAAIIAHEFEEFCETSRAKENSPERTYLANINTFLHHGRVHYQAASSFWKLLVDLQNMTGDCNQLTTFYVYLFSRRFPIDQLQIKTLPNHVCLHWKGIDIETTNGSFQNYKDYQSIGDITELVSINLLDVTDPLEAAASIVPESFVKAAQLASALSSNREITEHNLAIAYRNLCLAAIKQKNFPKANYFADTSGDPELKKACAIAEYNICVEKIRLVKTIKDAWRYKATYEKMLSLAMRFGDSEKQTALRKILGQLH